MNYLNLLNFHNLESLAYNLIRSGIILTIGFIIQMIGAAVIRQVTQHVLHADEDGQSALSQKVKTLVGIISNIWTFAVYGIVFLMILSSWGLDITPILTGAGILGLAIGFGTQTLVKDFVSGFFIIIENQYNIGDYIKVNGVEGVVQDLKLRTTILKENDGKIDIIPNSQVTLVTRTPKN